MPELSRDMVLGATGGRTVGRELPAVLCGVSTDTRSLQSGALFVALKGERFDAHDFVPEALERGAGAALVSRAIKSPGPLLLVPDTLAAFGALAAAHRAMLGARVVAVTGSTGKTTTKEMIAAVLSQDRKTGKTPGNYNNEIGVPLALLELDSSYEAAVVELAMRGRGQIGYLARMARPEVGVVTNIGLSHLEMLGSREAIAEAKAELLSGLPDSGAAVLNADDDFFSFLRERSPARVISFGYGSEADVRAVQVTVREDGGTEFALTGDHGEVRVSLRAPGRHHALNAAAAAAAAFSLGAKPEGVASGLEAFEGAEMRSRIEQAPGGYVVIDDCYNAAPDSMRVALELLADLPGKRKWAVLGDMKELGPLAPEWHREVGELAAAMGVTGLITLGQLGHYIAEGGRGASSLEYVSEAASNEDAAGLLKQRVSAGDVVLVKGSRAMEMENIVSALMEPDETAKDRPAR
jgi:UDP-N-acetylmuramoyl-tripeptide--D-alanyl-D-alanine ligase